MVGSVVLQMAQAASKDKEVWGHNRECYLHTNQCDNYYLLLVAIVQHDRQLKRVQLIKSCKCSASH